MGKWVKKNSVYEYEETFITRRENLDELKQTLKTKIKEYDSLPSLIEIKRFVRGATTREEIIRYIMTLTPILTLPYEIAELEQLIAELESV